MYLACYSGANPAPCIWLVAVGQKKVHVFRLLKCSKHFPMYFASYSEGLLIMLDTGGTFLYNECKGLMLACLQEIEDLHLTEEKAQATIRDLRTCLDEVRQERSELFDEVSLTRDGL